ncbi:MAG: ATP-dependent Lon protease [Fimbriimonadaceae bacterium]|jgi:ATP-dependent Lon protease|nr:ATP-dependent Lon protease [Fimbriimonadaceae bacterium]
MVRTQGPIKRENKKKTRLVPVLPARDAVHFPALINTLQVVRERSRKALRKALDGDRLVLVLSQRDMSLEEPGANDLYRVGTLSEVLQALPLPDSSLRVTLRGLRRAQVLRMIVRGGAFVAEIMELDDPVETSDVRAETLMRACVDTFGSVVQMHKSVPPEALETVVHLDTPCAVADTIAHHLPLRPAQKQELLEEPDQIHRLELVFEALKREQEVLELDVRIRSQVEAQLGSAHREYFLREQLRAIQAELQDREQATELQDYEERIRESGMPSVAAEHAMAEVQRLDRIPPFSPEGSVARNWLDCLIALPWKELSEDHLDVAAATRKLEEEHFALGTVKERVLDFLAVRQLTKAIRGPILCFAGPPGVGKTSIGRSIADAMGRKFCRISLGGLRDEAEIRGHRRTYVGAMPGRIIQAIRQAGTRNPVVMLDEIDKLGSDWRGDPTSALLEALDPEQNSRFEDHYLDAPFDLSRAMFIATANVAEMIPAPLRDRLEVIPFPGYSDDERVQIATRFLIPKIALEHGIKDRVSFKPEAVEALVRQYTRESGVRDLERKISGVCRKAARAMVEGSAKKLSIDESQLRISLGRPKHWQSTHGGVDEVGGATGLMVSEQGGEIVRVEASLMTPQAERPELRLTGRLGDVMKESAEAALTFVRTSEERLGLGRAFRFDVHVHVPDAGVPKDGPSAGLTIAIALVSAYTAKPVRRDVAMTGEITLRGRVLPVGGVREKILAAVRGGMTAVILPEGNRPDVEDMDTAEIGALKLHFVGNLDQAMSIALRTEATALAWV